MSNVYSFGPFEVDLTDRVVTREGVPVPLPPKVFDTLAVLVAREGRLVTKDELMREVWPDTFVDEANLTQNIFTLRRALAGPGPGDRSFIETVPRRGYRMGEPVQLVGRAGEAVVIERRQTVRVVTEEEVPSGGTGLWRGALGIAIAAAVLATVAAVVAIATRPVDRLEQLQVRRLTTSASVGDAAVSPDGRFVAYSTQDDDGWSIRLRQVATTSDVRIVAASEARLGSLTFTPDGEHVYYLRGDRGETELFQVSALGGNPRKVLDDVRSPVTFSPDGRRIAFVRWFPAEGEQSLMVAPAGGGEATRVATRKRPAVISYGGPSWSPDGERIAMVVNDSFSGPAAELVEVTLQDGSERVIAKGLGASAARVAWLPDGSGIVVESDQLWLHAYPGGERRRITNDASLYTAPSVSADSSKVAAVQTLVTTRVSVSPAGDLDHGLRIATGAGINNGLSWSPDGRIVYLATQEGNTDIWSMRADGSDPRQLTVDPGLDNHPAVCGSTAIVFGSTRAGGSTIWRMDPDGGNQQQISGAGAHHGMQCAPDGTWLVYHRAGPDVAWTVWRMPAGGGAATQLTRRPATFAAVSPDGRMVACNYLSEGAGPDDWKIAILAADGSGLVRLLEVPGVPTRRLKWSPDGRSIVFAERRNRVDNLVAVPVEGGAPVPITRFEEATILAFAWSPDGRQAALVRSTRISDAVLISGFR